MLATTRELAAKHNLTYSQTRYLIDQGVINPAPAKEGQAWELSNLDLWILEAAAILRNKKVSPRIIKKFTDLLQRYIEQFGDKANRESFFIVFYGDNYQDAVSAHWEFYEPWGGEWFIAIQNLNNGIDMAVEVLDQE